jgi:hypothetical protein
LHCDLLDIATLITITLKMKLFHIEMHEQPLQKTCLWMSKTLESKRGFKKGDMYVVIIVESTTIMSSILGF